MMAHISFYSITWHFTMVFDPLKDGTSNKDKQIQK